MNEFRTVYEMSMSQAFGSTLGVFLLIGLVVLCFLIFRHDTLGLIEKIFAWVWVIIWLGSSTTFYFWDLRNAFQLRGILKSKQYSIAEGIVKVLYEQPYQGHSVGDKIQISNTTFIIDYFDHSHPTYHKTIAHGGALRSGVYARVYHHGGVILRIDIKP